MNKATIYAVVVSVVLGIALFILSGNYLMAALILILVLFLISLFQNVKKNVYMIFFLAVFALFLMGRPIATDLFNYTKSYIVELDDNARNTMYISLILSLLSLAVGYNINIRIGKNRISIPAFKRCNTSEYMYHLQYVSRILTTILYLLAFLENIEIMLYFRTVGYTASYASYESSLPAVIHMFAEVAPIALAAYLATLPSRKNMILPTGIFFLAMSVRFLTGFRTEIVSAFMLFLVYCILRNRIDGNEAWIKKRTIVIITLLTPIGIAILQFVSSWRAGVFASFTTESHPYLDFLFGVGGNGYLIGYGDMYKDELAARGVLYSFGRVWNAVYGNTIAQIISPQTIYRSQTLGSALYGHSFGDAITYLLYPTAYIGGYGLATSYVAELFVDFSYAGVILGNILFGFVIRRVRTLKEKGMISNFLCIYLFSLLLRIPRDTFDYFMVEFIGLKNIACVIFLHLVTLTMIKKSNKYYRSQNGIV